MDITILLKDGTKREFKHEGRSGGSYTKTLSYQGTFAVVTDEFGKTFSFPAADIAEIQTRPIYGGW